MSAEVDMSKPTKQNNQQQQQTDGQDKPNIFSERSTKIDGAFLSELVT